MTKRDGSRTDVSRMLSAEQMSERVSRVRELRAQGMTIAQIAAMLGCCTWRVCQAINMASSNSRMAR